MFLRWRKRKQKAQQQAAVAGPESAPPQSRAGEAAPSESMTQRSSVTPLAAAGFLKRFRPTSQQTATTTETTPSERGFVNLGGRKLPSVFGPAGGDGFGGGYNREALSGSSFYRDSQGFYGGPGGAGPSTSPATPGPSRQPGQRPESDVAVLRPSPARTPVTSQGPAAPLPAPPRRPPTPRRQNSSDGIGRSHPSFDGSRGSRFQEEDV
ncbi:MAG: hypothetical protein M1835_003531 [Candelina submexicana]|nr:MAG: hypothetical protein M1835_003531 [Candelina submexicana]